MTNIEELSFSPEYFCDEIREGFFVSEAMKFYWAGQLAVLSEIDKLCRKHDINWYADCGTLLGAVRHKGYIPWDDDIDIAMFRDDYNRFMELAKTEFSDELLVRSSDFGDFDMPFGRVLNKGAYNFDSKFIAKYKGCPFSVGVDIFPMDSIYEDADKEEDRVKRGKRIYSLLEGIRHKSLSDAEIQKGIAIVERENNIVITRKKDPLKELLKLFDQIAKENNDENSEEIAVMIVWMGEGDAKFPRSCYDSWSEIPFETTKVRAPDGMNDVLEAYFGDYMKPVRGTASHGYPVYRELEDVFRDRYGKNPTCRFYFDKTKFTPRAVRKSFSDQQMELLAYLKGFHENIQEMINSQKPEEALKFLETCQNAAVTVGNSIEGRFGEGTEAVEALEQYCEKVYEASVNWNHGSKNELDDSLSFAQQKIEGLFNSSGKEVLFLLGKVAWWDSIKTFFAQTADDKRNDISVIPIPYSYLDYSRKLLGWQNDKELFEKIPELNCKLTSFDEYKLESKRPDIIVIQVPYDGYSGSLAIPEWLFSEKLLDYTDELVFVPYLEPDPPESKEDVAYAAMQELVEQPALFNADKVMVGSRKLRDYYIEKLVDMTGDEMRHYWEMRCPVCNWKEIAEDYYAG